MPLLWKSNFKHKYLQKGFCSSRLPYIFTGNKISFRYSKITCLDIFSKYDIINLFLKNQFYGSNKLKLHYKFNNI